MTRLWMIVAVLALTGCSLVNPHVFPAGPQPKELRAKSLPMDRAMEYSSEAKEKYRGALRDQAKLQAWLGIGLIPLSAAAIGLGAVGASPDAVLALGLTGASAFGTGTWLLNKPRQLAYVAGIKAVTCAEEAVSPLDVPDRVRRQLDDQIEILAQALPGLEAAISDVAAKAGVAAALANGVSSENPLLKSGGAALGVLVVSANDEIKTARGLVSSAKEARRSGVALQRTLDGAGHRLVNAVDKIADTVDGLILETQRDPQALATIIAGLGGAYKGLTTVPEGMKRATTTTTTTAAAAVAPESLVDLTPEEQQQLDLITAAGGELDAALQLLRASVTIVATAAYIVGDHVNAILTDAPLEKLKGCGVNAGDLVTALTVEPAQPIHVKKGEATSFTVKGGLGPYGGGLTGGAAGLTVTPATIFSPAFNVVTTPETPEGSYLVSIIDGAGHHLSVTVIVDPAAPPAAAPAAAASRAAAPAPASASDVQSFLDAMAKRPKVTVGNIEFTVTKAQLSQGLVLVTIEVGTVPKNAAITAPSMTAGVVKELHAQHGPKLDRKTIRIDNAGDLDAEVLKRKRG